MKHIILCAAFCAGLFSATNIYAIIDITGIKNATVNAGMPPVESADGAIDLTADGNASPFTFLWSNSATTEDIDHLLSGMYTVTVTNAFGCTKVLSATVRTCAGSSSPPPVIAITNYTITLISPFSPTQTGGGVSITVASTLGSITSGELYYKWVNQQTQQVVSASKDLVDVGPGTYCVTISGRCATQSACYTIPACAYAVPGGLFHLAFAPAPKPCPKQPNGGIDLTVSGPLTPYAYSWSNSATTQDLTNVKAGTYVVKVTDANGCFYSEAFTLPDAIEEVKLLNIKHYCSEESKGKIEIRPVPAGNYLYNWSNGVTGSGTSFLVDNLVAGQYCVTVTDPVSNCWTIKCWTISDGLPAESVHLEEFEHAGCHTFNGWPNLCIGSVSLSIDENVGSPASGNGYVYSWTGPNSYSTTTLEPNINDLCAGEYTVTVTNSDGCTVEKMINICCCDPGNSGTQANPAYDEACLTNAGWAPGSNYSPHNYKALVISGAAITGPNAANNYQGSIEVQVEFGVTPRFYNWEKIGDPSFEAHTALIQNLSAGTYCVTVNDGCSPRKAFAPPNTACFNLEPNIKNIIVKPSCPEGHNGIVTVNLAPNQAVPLRVAWSSGSQEGIMGNYFVAANLSAGNYIFTITDANNLTYYANATVDYSTLASAYSWPLSEIVTDKSFVFKTHYQCMNENKTSKISWDYDSFDNIPLLVVPPYPSLKIGWPDATESTVNINANGASGISGSDDFVVNAAGLQNVKVFDNESGCKVDFCFEFGEETNVPYEGAVTLVQLPATTITVNAYTGCYGCKQCGSQDCGNNGPACTEITGVEEFRYFPNNSASPCAGGGKLRLTCASPQKELEIPYVYEGVEYFDYTTPVNNNDGTCYYNGGCLFQYVPNYPAVFKDNFPLYVKIRSEDFSCEIPPDTGGGTTGAGCDGNITIVVTDETKCKGMVLCDEADGGIHTTFNVTLSEYITTYICKNGNDGPCLERKICSAGGGDEVMLETSVDCPTDVSGLLWCSLARPGRERSSEIGNSPNDFKGEGKIWVFPVPFSNYVKVWYYSISDGFSEISITDIAGRTFYHDQMPAKAGDNSFQIDFSESINPGVYFIALKRPDGSLAVKKLVRGNE